MSDPNQRPRFVLPTYDTRKPLSTGKKPPDLKEVVHPPPSPCGQSRFATNTSSIKIPKDEESKKDAQPTHSPSDPTPQTAKQRREVKAAEDGVVNLEPLYRTVDAGAGPEHLKRKSKIRDAVLWPEREFTLLDPELVPRLEALPKDELVDQNVKKTKEIAALRNFLAVYMADIEQAKVDLMRENKALHAELGTEKKISGRKSRYVTQAHDALTATEDTAEQLKQDKVMKEGEQQSLEHAAKERDQEHAAIKSINLELTDETNEILQETLAKLIGAEKTRDYFEQELESSEQQIKMLLDDRRDFLNEIVGVEDCLRELEPTLENIRYDLMAYEDIQAARQTGPSISPLSSTNRLLWSQVSVAPLEARALTLAEELGHRWPPSRSTSRSDSAVSERIANALPRRNTNKGIQMSPLSHVGTPQRIATGPVPQGLGESNSSTRAADVPRSGNIGPDLSRPVAPLNARSRMSVITLAQTPPEALSIGVPIVESELAQVPMVDEGTSTADLETIVPPKIVTDSNEVEAILSSSEESETLPGLPDSTSGSERNPSTPLQVFSNSPNLKLEDKTTPTEASDRVLVLSPVAYTPVAPHTEYELSDEEESDSANTRPDISSTFSPEKMMTRSPHTHIDASLFFPGSPESSGLQALINSPGVGFSFRAAQEPVAGFTKAAEGNEMARRSPHRVYPNCASDALAQMRGATPAPKTPRTSVIPATSLSSPMQEDGSQLKESGPPRKLGSPFQSPVQDISKLSPELLQKLDSGGQISSSDLHDHRERFFTPRAPTAWDLEDPAANNPFDEDCEAFSLNPAAKDSFYVNEEDLTSEQKALRDLVRGKKSPKDKDFFPAAQELLGLPLKSLGLSVAKTPSPKEFSTIQNLYNSPSTVSSDSVEDSIFSSPNQSRASSKSSSAQSQAVRVLSKRDWLSDESSGKFSGSSEFFGDSKFSPDNEQSRGLEPHQLLGALVPRDDPRRAVSAPQSLNPCRLHIALSQASILPSLSWSDTTFDRQMRNAGTQTNPLKALPAAPLRRASKGPREESTPSREDQPPCPINTSPSASSEGTQLFPAEAASAKSQNATSQKAKKLVSFNDDQNTELLIENRSASKRSRPSALAVPESSIGFVPSQYGEPPELDPEGFPVYGPANKPESPVWSEAIDADAAGTAAAYTAPVRTHETEVMGRGRFIFSKPPSRADGSELFLTPPAVRAPTEHYDHMKDVHDAHKKLWEVIEREGRPQPARTGPTGPLGSPFEFRSSREIEESSDGEDLREAEEPAGTDALQHDGSIHVEAPKLELVEVTKQAINNEIVHREPEPSQEFASFHSQRTPSGDEAHIVLDDASRMEVRAGSMPLKRHWKSVSADMPEALLKAKQIESRRQTLQAEEDMPLKPVSLRHIETHTSKAPEKQEAVLPKSVLEEAAKINERAKRKSVEVIAGDPIRLQLKHQSIASLEDELNPRKPPFENPVLVPANWSISSTMTQREDSALIRSGAGEPEGEEDPTDQQVKLLGAVRKTSATRPSALAFRRPQPMHVALSSSSSRLRQSPRTNERRR